MLEKATLFFKNLTIETSDITKYLIQNFKDFLVHQYWNPQIRTKEYLNFYVWDNFFINESMAHKPFASSILSN